MNLFRTPSLSILAAFYSRHDPLDATAAKCIKFSRSENYHRTDMLTRRYSLEELYLQRAIYRREPSLCIFLDAEREVFHLLEQDSFPRFKKSKEWHAFVHSGRVGVFSCV